MSVSFFMISSLFLSYFFCTMTNSWLVIWVLLEVNTLAFCSLMKMSSKEDTQKNSEMVMKYFIVQSIASSVFVMSSFYEKQSKFILWMSLVVVITLMVKVASAPFHQWFLDVAKSLKWMMNLVLFTWQKMAPLYLILYQLKKLSLGFVVFSAFIGAISMINKKELKEVLAWSSVFNLGWILMAIMVSTKIFFFFLFLYWLSVFFVVYSIYVSKVTSMEMLLQPFKKDLSLFFMANLAGIPPLIGFMAKWLTFSESLKVGYFFLPSILLVLSTINFYVYLRVMSNSILKNSVSNQKQVNMSFTNFNVTFLMVNIITLISVAI